MIMVRMLSPDDMRACLKAGKRNIDRKAMSCSFAGKDNWMSLNDREGWRGLNRLFC